MKLGRTVTIQRQLLRRLCKHYQVASIQASPSVLLPGDSNMQPGLRITTLVIIRPIVKIQLNNRGRFRQCQYPDCDTTVWLPLGKTG
jgi:hypothetical protein